jgi:cytochrome c-type biogenesis protein
MALFIAGFSVVFTSLGAFAGALVPLVRSTTGQRVAGLVVLVVGAFLLLYAFRAGPVSLYAEGRPLISRVRPGGAAAFPLGMAFAAGWTPCIGPVLAGILTLATAQSDPVRSALLLLAFSMGLGVPFLLIGLGVGGLFRRLGFLQRHYHAIAGVSGAVLVAIGFLLMSGASGQLAPKDLRGKVVVVNFCTYTCINWLRTLPYVRAWAETYERHGLVMIGVHTPEFSFEHDLENVRSTCSPNGI